MRIVRSDTFARGLVWADPNIAGSQRRNLAGTERGALNGTYPGVGGVPGNRRVVTDRFDGNWHQTFAFGDAYDTAPITVCCWLYKTSANAIYAFHNIQVSPSPFPGFVLSIDDSGFGGTYVDGRLGLWTGDDISGASGWLHYEAGAGRLRDRPIFVAGVIDTANRYLYLDGVQVASGSHTPDLTTTNHVHYGNHEYNANLLSGWIWNTRIYKRALSPAVIRALYKHPWSIYTRRSYYGIAVDAGAGGTTHEVALALAADAGLTNTALVSLNRTISLGADAGVTLAEIATAEESLTLAADAGATFAEIATNERAVTLAADAGDSYATDATAEASLALAANAGQSLTEDATLERAANFAADAGLALAEVQSFESALTLSGNAALTFAADVTLEAALTFGVDAALSVVEDGSFERSAVLAASASLVADRIATLERAISQGAEAGLSLNNAQTLDVGLTLAVTATLTTSGINGLVTITTPDSRTLFIQADDRTLVVQADDRTLFVLSDD